MPSTLYRASSVETSAPEPRRRGYWLVVACAVAVGVAAGAVTLAVVWRHGRHASPAPASATAPLSASPSPSPSASQAPPTPLLPAAYTLPGSRPQLSLP